VSSVGFVTLAFLSLFFFIDFVDDLDAIGRKGYTPCGTCRAGRAVRGAGALLRAARSRC
jgi:hypothetical protein